MSAKTHRTVKGLHERRPLQAPKQATGSKSVVRYNNKPSNIGSDFKTNEFVTLKSQISDSNHINHRMSTLSHQIYSYEQRKAIIRQDCIRDGSRNRYKADILECSKRSAKTMRPAKPKSDKPSTQLSLRFASLFIVLVSLTTGLAQISHCLEVQLNAPSAQQRQQEKWTPSKELNQTAELDGISSVQNSFKIVKTDGNLNGNHTTSKQNSRQLPITTNSDSNTVANNGLEKDSSRPIDDLASLAAASSLASVDTSSALATATSAPRDLATRGSQQVASTKPIETMVTSASKKKKKMMKKKKKMEKKHKEWKKGKKHKKKKYESKKKKGGMEKKKKGKKEKKKWGMEKKGHKKKGNFKKKKWGSKKKMKKGAKKGKKGKKMLKDKGYKKKGFKKVYHKEEWGKKKKWHDIKREKKWNTKQKKWKKKWHQEKGKKYKGKHMKKYHKKNKHGKKYKKEKKSKWKKHKGEKFKKGHKKKKEEYAKKKEGGKKKKMKKMKKEMKKKKG